MTDEELIALADRLAQLGDSGWLIDGEADDCEQAAAAIRTLVAERGK